MTKTRQLKHLGSRVLTEALLTVGLTPRRRSFAGPAFGMVGGLALGTAAGLFLAPRPGRELLARVIRQVKAWRK